MNIKKVSKDAMIILAISLILLVISDLILRIVFPEKTNDSTLAYEFNADYLVSLKPYIKKKFVRSRQNGGDIIHWQTNKNAFRGSALKENPQRRLIVYGDSNVQARFSQRENTFVHKLEASLKQKGLTNPEVINAGVVGFGPDQSLMRFAKEADIYQPDLVIFHIFADNDFGDLVRNRLFELDANGHLIETTYKKTVDPHLTVASDFLSSLLIVKATKKLARLFTEKQKWPDEKAEQLHTLQNLIVEEYAVYKNAQPKQFSHFADHYDIDIALNPAEESSQLKIKLMAAVLKKAQRLAESKGIQFLVVIQPSVIDLTQNNAVLNYAYLQQKYAEYNRRNLTQAVENACIKNAIHCVNLFDVFLKNNPENLFFKADDNHWNDHGQDIAAKETAAYITRQLLKIVEK